MAKVKQGTLQKLKTLIERFKIDFKGDKSIVTRRDNGQIITAETPDEKLELNKLVNALTLADSWIETAPIATEGPDLRDNPYGYNKMKYDYAFSSIAEKDFDSMLSDIGDLLNNKKPNEVTTYDFYKLGDRNSRLRGMVNHEECLVDKNTADRNKQTLLDIAVKQTEKSNHPLQHYKDILEKYDIELQLDEKNPLGWHMLLKDRQTGEIVLENDKQAKLKLCSDVLFAKSWVNANAGAAKNGKTNKLGYDEAQYDKAFSADAETAFDKVVKLFEYNDGKSVAGDELKENVYRVGQTPRDKEQAMYEQSIVGTLFRKRESPSLLATVFVQNIVSQFNKQAGSNVIIKDEQLIEKQ